MQEERIKSLINKYLAQNLTEEENQELDYFIKLHPSLPGLLERQGSAEVLRKAALKMADTDTGKNLDITLGRIQRHLEVQRRTRRMVGGVTLFLLVLGIVAGIYQWRSPHKPGSTATEVVTHPADIAPGANRASLLLADGKKIWLDTVRTGPITGAGNVRVQKLDSSTLAYTVSSGEGIHILETPRAGSFKVILSDGTRVWLNNESRLQYPGSFTGTAREVVLLTGEAYFEVAKDLQRPFRVRIGEMTEEVLGTEFNVSAYPNDTSVTTTLLSGAVSLHKDEAHIRLMPGEQGVYIPGEGHAEIHVLQHIDTDNIIAWRENKFYFFHADLSSVLRQLERWYNVEIGFRGPPSKRVYEFYRTRTDISLNNVLKLLRLHSHWEGRKLIVTE